MDNINIGRLLDKLLLGNKAIKKKLKKRGVVEEHK